MSRASRFAKCFCRNKYNEACENIPYALERVWEALAFVGTLVLLVLCMFLIIWAGGSVVLFFMPIDVVLWQFDSAATVCDVVVQAFSIWLICSCFAFIYVAVVGGLLLGLCEFVVFLWSNIVLAWEQSKGDGQ